MIIFILHTSISIHLLSAVSQRMTILDIIVMTMMELGRVEETAKTKNKYKKIMGNFLTPTLKFIKTIIKIYSEVTNNLSLQNINT